MKTPEFVDTFQELYFNERIFEQVPESIKVPMENIVLAVGLTNTDNDEIDPFGAQLDEDGLRHALNENMPHIEGTLEA